MAKSIKLKCVANAHVDGKVVLSGTVDEYPSDLGARLLISNRFKKTEDDVKEVKAVKAKADAK